MLITGCSLASAGAAPLRGGAPEPALPLFCRLGREEGARPLNLLQEPPWALPRERDLPASARDWCVAAWRRQIGFEGFAVDATLMEADARGAARRAHGRWPARSRARLHSSGRGAIASASRSCSLIPASVRSGRIQATIRSVLRPSPPSTVLAAVSGSEFVQVVAQPALLTLSGASMATFSPTYARQLTRSVTPSHHRNQLE